MRQARLEFDQDGQVTGVWIQALTDTDAEIVQRGLGKLAGGEGCLAACLAGSGYSNSDAPQIEKAL